MIKSKFGPFVRARTETARFNEVLAKVLCHNLCVLVKSMYQLGIKPDFVSSFNGLLDDEEGTLGMAA